MASLKVNEGIMHTMGRISGHTMGAAWAWDKGMSSDMVRYGAIGVGAAAGLWGASDPGDMGGMRGAIGAVGAGYAAFAGGGAWLNSHGGMTKVINEATAKSGVMALDKTPAGVGRYWTGVGSSLHEGAAWGGKAIGAVSGAGRVAAAGAKTVSGGA